jgi:CheY-like chemotaxis protein
VRPGFEKRLRPIGSSKPPVVLVSGYSDQFTAEKAHAAGFDGYLDKPVRPSMLAQLVRKVLDRDRPRMP